VYAFVVKPADFSPSKKYPVLLLIHGGPQGAWGETWSYRWNPQIFASAGYLVVMPNPRGSTGYGQKFIDDINGDWGGKVYDDIMAVTDHVAALHMPIPSGWPRRADRTVAIWSIGSWATPRASRRSSRTPESSICAAWPRRRRSCGFQVGVQRHAVGQPGHVREMVAQLFS